MKQTRLAWIALKTMTRTAGRDPLWAIVALITAPFRHARSVVMTSAGFLVIAVVAFASVRFLIHWISGDHPDVLILRIGDLLLLIFLLLVLFRLVTNPLILHFGDIDGGTHGSARFANPREIAPLATAQSGLLIGRDAQTNRLLRYDGPAHLMTMAPTRTGKGVGTIIPNLLTAERSVICIDPKGENAVITARARQMFGPVHILDPFGVTGHSNASFNPLNGLDPDSIDLADDVNTLADALVFDEPGTGGEAHWNEEAKALIAGLILRIVATEPPAQKTLSTLRRDLTLAPERFASLLTCMQDSDAACGLIARAANRHLGKSDREAAGVLSAAQRHTHFLDSPRMAAALGRSDFRFSDLKTRTITVFLVLPPDRLASYARWLRLLVTQSLIEMAVSTVAPPLPVLYLLDEFAALGRLTAVERAMGLMAGYGVQLWPILQDIHQLRATYGQRSGTFLSNAGVLQVFGVNDHQSARVISDLLGQETVVFQTMARSLDSDRSGLSFSQQHVGRPLLTPDEVRNLPSQAQLLFLAGQRPVIAQKLRYFSDPEFASLANLDRKTAS